MTLSNEKIREILEGAPDGASQWDGLTKNYYDVYDEFNLAHLREILTLRQRIEALKAQQSEVAAHSDDEAVHQFACAMKGKMAAARAKGREGWETCDPYSLAQQFVEHLTRCNEGNYLDLANYCMMLHQRGESTVKLAQMVSRMKNEVAARAVEKFLSLIIDCREIELSQGDKYTIDLIANQLRKGEGDAQKS